MAKKNIKKIYLLNPRGFCSGVKRAVAVVNKALEIYPVPIYVLHDIIHNEQVVDGFKKKGVIFKNSLKKIPENSILIFSAHGVGPKIRKEAEAKKLIVIDATCPLVFKIHNEAIKFYREKYKIILIGEKGHHEVTGIMGEAPMALISRPEDVKKLDFTANARIACLTQTTFLKLQRDNILKMLKSRYKNISLPLTDDICSATADRRQAITAAKSKINLLLVAGSEKSNNAKRLVDQARQTGIKALLISSNKRLNFASLEKYGNIGVTAAASAPEEEVSAVIEKIKNKFAGTKIKEIGRKGIEPDFSLPF